MLATSTLKKEIFCFCKTNEQGISQPIPSIHLLMNSISNSNLQGWHRSMLHFFVGQQVNPLLFHKSAKAPNPMKRLKKCCIILTLYPWKFFFLLINIPIKKRELKQLYKVVEPTNTLPRLNYNSQKYPEKLDPKMM